MPAGEIGPLLAFGYLPVLSSFYAQSGTCPPWWVLLASFARGHPLVALTFYDYQSAQLATEIGVCVNGARR